VNHRSAAIIAASVMLLLSACSRGQKNSSAPSPDGGYVAAVTAAEKRAEAGDYVGADRILADFALKAKGTSGAAEASFWRAMYMVDPLNKTASVASGIRALDIYLDTPGARMYRAQALVLRRTAQTVVTLRQAAQSTVKVVGRDTVYVSREEERISSRRRTLSSSASRSGSRTPAADQPTLKS
jgi:hypothetical protein